MIRPWSLGRGLRYLSLAKLRGHRKMAEARPSRSTVTGRREVDDGPPDWMNISLPPDHVLSHLTDAHCHPTDLDQTDETYDSTKLGGLAVMATEPENQEKVKALSIARPWPVGRDPNTGQGAARRIGPRMIACFGYHPWFTHRYTLQDTPPSKEQHYTSIFFPSSEASSSTSSPIPDTKKGKLLDDLLPYLPEPIPFDPLLSKLKDDIQESLARGQLTMLGEVGLDGGARLRYPMEGRHLHPELSHLAGPPSSSSTNQTSQQSNTAQGNEDHNHNQSQSQGKGGEGEGHQDDQWLPLTPFKTSMAHQLAILEKQIELAIDLGVNISLHSVAAPGPTFEILVKMRDKHRTRFTNGINVDIHSGGGFSPEFWKQTEKNFLNVYASPSIFITSRSSQAPSLIRAISNDKILVESDSHDVTLSTKTVWAATEWISRCKGWSLEGQDTPPWSVEGRAEDDEEESGREPRGNEGGTRGEVWTVRTLERNFNRFMTLSE